MQRCTLGYMPSGLPRVLYSTLGSALPCTPWVHLSCRDAVPGTASAGVTADSSGQSPEQAPGLSL